MSRIMSKLKGWFSNFLYFDTPPLELSSKREEEIIEKVAQEIIKRDLDQIALITLGWMTPIAPMVTQVMVFPIATMLELLGISSYEYVTFFSKRENVQRLFDRLEELSTQRRI